MAYLAGGSVVLGMTVAMRVSEEGAMTCLTAEVEGVAVVLFAGSRILGTDLHPTNRVFHTASH
jgi:hypothetical protein